MGTLSWKQWAGQQFCSNRCRGDADTRWWHFFRDGRAYVIGRNGQRVYWSRIVVQNQRGGEPLPEGSVVHHINRDVTDDRPENLRVLASSREHMREHHRQGEWWFTNRKLTREQVEEIRGRFAATTESQGKFTRRVGPEYGVAPGTVAAVVARRSWT